MVLYAVGLALWITLRPADRHTVILVDAVFRAVGPLVVLAAALALAWKRRSRVLSTRGTLHRYFLLASGMGLLGIICGTVSQALSSYETLVLHSTNVTPLIDIVLLCAYPCFFVAILAAVLMRVAAIRSMPALTESFLIVLTVYIIGAYLLIDPTWIGHNTKNGMWVLRVAYPLADLALLALVGITVSYRSNGRPQPTQVTLLLGFAIMIASDLIYTFQDLHQAYTSGQLLDLARPLSSMLIGLGVILLWRPSVMWQIHNDRRHTIRDALQAVGSFGYLVRAMIPFALLIVLEAFVVTVTVRSRAIDSNPLDAAIQVGLALFIAVLTVHQTLVAGDTRRLHERWKHAEEQLRTTIEQLDALASRDPMTGLANRRQLVETLDRQLVGARRYGFNCAVLFVDLDKFKQVNDRYGHMVGDTVLRAFGTLIQDVLRSADVVGRWGGEEFLAVLPQTGKREAYDAAERLRHAVETRMTDHLKGFRFTCSIGVAAYPEDAEDAHGLVEAADRAMYVAKVQGRNQVQLAGVEHSHSAI